MDSRPTSAPLNAINASVRAQFVRKVSSARRQIPIAEAQLFGPPPVPPHLLAPTSTRVRSGAGRRSAKPLNQPEKFLNAPPWWLGDGAPPIVPLAERTATRTLPEHLELPPSAPLPRTERWVSQPASARLSAERTRAKPGPSQRPDAEASSFAQDIQLSLKPELQVHTTPAVHPTHLAGRISWLSFDHDLLRSRAGDTCGTRGRGAERPRVRGMPACAHRGRSARRRARARAAADCLCHRGVCPRPQISPARCRASVRGGGLRSGDRVLF